MTRNILTIAITLIFGIAIGAYAGSREAVLSKVSDADSQAVVGATLDTSWLMDEETRSRAANDPQLMLQILDSLSAILNAEVAERRVLADELFSLREQLMALEANLGERAVQAISERRVEDRELRFRGRDPASSIEERLLLAGFDPDLARTVRQREDERQMKELYLRDQATREGWLNSQRYQQEIQELRTSGATIRQELGDDRYDQYLYAMGRPNRIGVDRVLKTSPAQQSGLREGDSIVAYDGERIFSVQELIAYETRGKAGETVTMEVIRDGRRVQIYVPRGPLGFTPSYRTVDPNNPADGN